MSTQFLSFIVEAFITFCLIFAAVFVTLFVNLSDFFIFCYLNGLPIYAILHAMIVFALDFPLNITSFLIFFFKFFVIFPDIFIPAAMNDLELLVIGNINFFVNYLLCSGLINRFIELSLMCDISHIDYENWFDFLRGLFEKKIINISLVEYLYKKNIVNVQFLADLYHDRVIDYDFLTILCEKGVLDTDQMDQIIFSVLRHIR